MGEEYVYVAVDETGNLGRSMKGERYYTLVACVVNDRKRFEDATRRLGFDEEVKFQTHDLIREKVLKYASPAVSEVFYVRYRKKNGILNRFEQSDLHLRMIHSLADTIVLRYGLSNNLVVEVDHRDGISDWIVQKAFEDNGYRRKIVLCEVVDSTSSYGLQTNDFFVGAIGRMVNWNDVQYARMMKAVPKECYIHNYNEKRREPASATPVEYRPHGQSVRDSPSGIAAEFRTKCSVCPAVRLGGTRKCGYMKHSVAKTDCRGWKEKILAVGRGIRV